MRHHINPLSNVTATAGATASASELLAAHHRDLDQRLDALVVRAQGGDICQLRDEWVAFERQLLRHLDVEEAELLPGFARHYPAVARVLLEEHAAIRAELLELGTTLDLHMLRAARVAKLVEQLRAHARREEQALYAWAERHTSVEGQGVIARRLQDPQLHGHS